MCRVLFKLEGVQFFELLLPADTSTTTLILQVEHYLHLPEQLRVVVSGQAMQMDQQLSHYLRNGRVTVSLLQAVHGGGMTKKQQDHQQAMTHLTKLLVAHGLSVTHAREHAKVSIQKLGTQTVLQACVGCSDTQTWSSLQAQADARAFTLLPPLDQMSKSVQKIQQLYRRKQAQKAIVPACRDLKLLDGWL